MSESIDQTKAALLALDKALAKLALNNNLDPIHCPSDLLENNSLESLLGGIQKKLFQDKSEVPDMKKIDALKEVCLLFESDRPNRYSSHLPSIIEEK